MKYLILFFFMVSCQSNKEVKTLKKENQQLSKEVDSLRNELQKCDMMLEVYEGSLMNI